MTESEVTLKDYDTAKPALPAVAYQERRQVSLAYTLHVAASSRLYVAPQVTWIDRNSTLELTYGQNGPAPDVAGVRAQQVLLCRADRLAYPIRDGIPFLLEDEAQQLSSDDPLLRERT